MRIDPGYKDVTKYVFTDDRDERIPRQVRECWEEEQLKGWQSAQSAAHKKRSAKQGRRKIG